MWQEVKGRSKAEGSLRVDFWNVAGLSGKNEGFWERFKEWDVVELMETWVKLNE